jgi:hypothetical protein
MRRSYDIAADELGTVVGVEPHPAQTGPTYRIEVQFERVRVPYIFKFEYELVRAAQLEHGTKEAVTTITPHVSKNDVDAFYNFCVSLRSIFRHYHILFNEGAADLRRELLTSIAPTCKFVKLLIEKRAAGAKTSPLHSSSTIPTFRLHRAN